MSCAAVGKQRVHCMDNETYLAPVLVLRSEGLQVVVEEVTGGQKWPVLEHTNPAKPNRTRVVVLGSGWGAISMVKALNNKIRSAVTQLA